MEHDEDSQPSSQPKLVSIAERQQQLQSASAHLSRASTFAAAQIPSHLLDSYSAALSNLLSTLTAMQDLSEATLSWAADGSTCDSQEACYAFARALEPALSMAVDLAVTLRALSDQLKTDR